MTEMTELTEYPQSPEDLLLTPQYAPVIPMEIRNLRLAEQLPHGYIAYFDVNEPETFRLISQESWKPIIKDGVELRKFITELGVSRFAGVILHTPTRNPDNSYDEEIETLTKLLKRSSEKEDGIIKEHHSGTIFIVEERGEDVKVIWREKQLKLHGLVVDRMRGERSVIVGDKYVISQGRRPKIRSAVNLMQGITSGNMFSDFPDAIRRGAETQGLEADTRALEEEARATNFVPRTISNLRDGGNVTFKGIDEDGKAIQFSTDRRGEENSLDPSRFEKISVTPKKMDLPKPGTVIMREDLECPFGHHPMEMYYSEPGKKRHLLFRDIVCNGAHPDGYPWFYGKHKYIRPLGLIPVAKVRQNTKR